MMSAKVIPYTIVAVFVSFAAYIGHFVYRSTQANINLVSEDYYQKEIAFQETYDARVSSVEANKSVKVIPEDGHLKVEFSEMKNGGGKIVFFRPDDPALDHDKVLPRTQKSLYDLSKMKEGLWFYELHYKSGGNDYLKEGRFWAE